MQNERETFSGNRLFARRRKETLSERKRGKNPFWKRHRKMGHREFVTM